MFEPSFTAWALWTERESLPECCLPGVYIVAASSERLSGTPFGWRPDIIYVGMTNAASGLKGRLRKFDRTIGGKRGHGGADRVSLKHPDAAEFRRNAFVAVASFRCDPQSNQPADLRTMGEVAKFEYECLARFVEAVGHLPEFNDKKRSPKRSRNSGRLKRS